jgi:hypothetical protein
MFGQFDSTRDDRYIYWGLKRRTNAEAREQFHPGSKPHNQRSR